MAASHLARKFEAIAGYACLAAVTYFVFIFLAQHAYEQFGWMALGRREEAVWVEMRQIARFDFARGTRFFLIFMFMGVLYLTLEQVRASLASRLVLSVIVAPVVLPSLCNFVTTRELSGLPAWSMWLVVCALFYWQRKLGASWRIDLVIWVLIAIGFAAIARIDQAMWTSTMALKANALGMSPPGARVSQLHFMAAEVVYLAGQVITAFVLPRKAIHIIAIPEPEPEAEQTGPFAA